MERVLNFTFNKGAKTISFDYNNRDDDRETTKKKNTLW